MVAEQHHQQTWVLIDQLVIIITQDCAGKAKKPAAAACSSTTARCVQPKPLEDGRISPSPTLSHGTIFTRYITTSSSDSSMLSCGDSVLQSKQGVPQQHNQSQLALYCAAASPHLSSLRKQHIEPTHEYLLLSGDQSDVSELMSDDVFS